MSLITGLKNELKNAVLEALDLNQQLGEAAALRALYAKDNPKSTLPNTWYRLHGESGACLGFSYVCNCHTEYQLISVFDWFRVYDCKACHAKIDLLKHVGIKNAAGELTLKNPEAWLAAFSALPVRPRLAGPKPQERVIDTWASKKNDDDNWGGAPPSIPAGW